MNPGGNLFSGDRVQPHEVGGAGSLARAGHDAQNVAGLEQAAGHQFVLGDRDHVFGRERPARCMGCAPQKRFIRLDTAALGVNA